MKPKFFFNSFALYTKCSNVLRTENTYYRAGRT